MRAAQARALAALVPRTSSWIPLAVTVTVATLALYAAPRAPQPLPDGNLSLVGVVLATWLSSVLGDRAAAIADATARTVLFRRCVRIATALALVVLLWSGALLWASPGPHTATLTLLFVSQLAVALALAGSALRTVEAGREPLVAIVGLFAIYAGLPFVFDLDLSPIPTSDTWWFHTGRWLSLTVLGVVGFIWSSRDPSSRFPAPAAGIAAAHADATPPAA